MIYNQNAATPEALRSIAPSALAPWVDDSVLRDLHPYSNMLQPKLDEEPVRFDELLLAMAERLFAIERGLSPRTFGELLGPDLKALPERIAPYDPVKPGSP
jgi:hypothetical protein